MRHNYYIYVDREGKMPFLSGNKRKSVSHPYYIRYVNDTPVAYHGPTEVHAQDVTKSKVWDYRQACYVPIANIPQE